MKNTIQDFFNIDELNGNIKVLETKLQKLVQDRDYTGGICICSHNTILALTFDGEVSHIVNVDGKRNIVNLGTVSAYLDVPRYEPKVAKIWLNEELVMTRLDDTSEETQEMKEMNARYGKKTLSEYELRNLLITCTENDIINIKSILDAVIKYNEKQSA